MNNDTEQFWKGEFGDAYLKRNQVDWRARIPFWESIMEMTGARSVWEFGCNAGWNLSAIMRACPDAALYGTDINQKALEQATAAGIEWVGDKLGKKAMFELTFTAGVLIHIPPEDLQPTMDDLVQHSHRWVLAVEYDYPVSQEVEYRGHAGKLWKRPYGRLYEDMGLELVRSGEARGFDQCTFWLLEKK